jgi:SET domain-containing protein
MSEAVKKTIHYCSPKTLLIKKSGIHGSGCYTLGAIPEGAYVAEYTGMVLTKEQADDLYSERPDTYLFCLGEGETVIDGDNVAAFINHSCDPNCETDEVEGRVWVIATREITPGEELTYDYNLYDGDDDDEAPCSCGAEECRGTMYGEEEIERRAKEKERAERKAGEGASPAACD